jgi:hypothetical protein
MLIIILIWPKFKLLRSFGEYSYRIIVVIEKFQIILLVTHSSFYNSRHS